MNALPRSRGAISVARFPDFHPSGNQFRFLNEQPFEKPQVIRTLKR